MKEKYIYFMRPIGMLGPIKIGCSDTPHVRLEELAVWSPFPLEIIVKVPGDFQLENRLHRAFSKSHLHREWFNHSKELLDGIRLLLKGEDAYTAFDLTKNDGPIRRWSRPMSEDTKLRSSYSQKVGWAQKRLRKSLGDRGAWHAPEDVVKIIDQWRGPYRGQPSPPTPAGIARLDEYLANPGLHSVVASWWAEISERAA